MCGSVSKVFTTLFFLVEVKLKRDFSFPIFLDSISVVERREDFVSFGDGVLTYIGGVIFFVFNEVINPNFRLLNFLRSN